MYIKAQKSPFFVKTVLPINYELEFEPNFTNFTFAGKEKILIDFKKPTNSFSLNAAELKIKKCQIEHDGKIHKTKFKLDEKNEELRINVSKKIKGNATLHIDFAGILNDRLLGFYRSQYNIAGKTKYLATTQFEAADARRAFPCWDEPQAKATFEISLIVDTKYSAISNMPEISRKKSGKKIHHKFAKTPIMSTYLIYLGVGEFEFLKGRTGKIDIRVITTKGNKSKGKYALDLGKKLLSAYEKYFGIRYPLPKLDLIAIPDFAAGAMENWGAITFRETILLYDPKISSTKTKQFIAEVVSHEIAHQWFGNLVTMKWWNDLWLNESFATFMATKFVDKFYPEWDLWDQFIEDAMNTAMNLDSLKSSHPIDVKVNKPSEIREIFDAISYDKGGCVLRMLEHYVTEKNFKKGLQHYLKKFEYKNAKGDDLWDAIGKVSKMPVKSMVNTWIRQVGYPLVDVEKKNATLILTQKRFLMDSDSANLSSKWIIPVSISSGKASYTKSLTSRSAKFAITGDMPVVNSGRFGFFRVRYSDELLNTLRNSIDEKKISPIDRWALQNDLYSLCVARLEQVKSYLELSESYYSETDYLVAVNVANNLESLYLRTFNEPFSNIIRAYTQNYFRLIFERLGWSARKNESHTDALLRPYVISVLGKLGEQDILDEAKTQFTNFLKNPNSIAADLREAVYSLVAWDGDESTYNTLLKLYKKANTQEEKLRFLSAMCSFKDEKLLKKTLDFSQSKDVRSQNIHLPIMKISSNPYGKKIVWPWLQKNWRSLRKKVGFGNPLLNRVVSSISQVIDDSQSNEVRKFFKKNPTPGTERTLDQTLERVKINSKFLASIRKEFSSG